MFICCGLQLEYCVFICCKLQLHYCVFICCYLQLEYCVFICCGLQLEYCVFICCMLQLEHGHEGETHSVGPHHWTILCLGSRVWSQPNDNAKILRNSKTA